MRSGLLRCAAADLTSGASRGVTFKVAQRRRFSLPGVGARVAGYRIVGTASRPDQSVGAYLDMVVIAKGQTITQISYSTLLAPPKAQLETRLARLVASRFNGR
jgi:hypothetical protein